MSGVVRTNWARNEWCTPTAVHQPRNEAEVVALVQHVRSSGGTLKAIGAGHSWTGAAMTDGHLVNLDHLCRVRHVDRATGLVIVEAGARLHALIDVLAQHGLAMENLGSVAEQSVAGAISTGTHGTGLGLKNLASQVVALRLVTGTGKVLVLDTETDGDLLNAARVSLGCLGIITEVTLACVPAFNLEERSWALSFDEAVRELPALISNEEHLKYWWLPHTGKVQVFAYNRTALDVTPTKPYAARLDRWINEVAFGGVVSLTRRYPRLAPSINRLIGLGYFSEGRRVGRSDHLFNVAMPPKHLEMEYAVSADDAPELMQQTRALIKARRLNVNFVQELRFAAGDEAWLSPAYGRDTCHFGAYMGQTSQTQAYFDGFEAMALKMGGRPHWGKIFGADGAAILGTLPKATDFNDLRREWDPADVFTSRFSRHLWPIQG